MTADAIRAHLSSPTMLFVVMLLASFANGMKQLLVVRQTGQPMKCIEYWSHVPETVTTLVSNVLAFALLVSIDQLNLASALGVGYGLNSISDLIPRGRSYALKQTADDPTKVVKP